MRTALTVLGLLNCATIASAQTDAVVTGTYRIAVCRISPCSPDDTSTSVAWGTLILGDTTIKPSGNRRLDAPFLNGPANGCWVMSRRRRHVPTNAGIGDVSSTTWSSTGGANPTVTVNLRASPDAKNVVTARFENGTLRGYGIEANAGDGPAGSRRDTIVAVRIGPADYSLCVQAAAQPARTAPSIEGMNNLHFEIPARADTFPRIALVLYGGTTTAPPTPPQRNRAGNMWDPGTLVVMVPRPSQLSLSAFADSVQAQVSRWRSSGVGANRITIIGNGEGAAAVARVSSQLDDRIGYVIIDGCLPDVVAAANSRLHGDVLSLIPAGGSGPRSCNAIFSQSPGPGSRIEMQVSATAPIFSSPYGVAAWTDLVSDWIHARQPFTKW